MSLLTNIYQAQHAERDTLKETYEKLEDAPLFQSRKTEFRKAQSEFSQLSTGETIAETVRTAFELTSDGNSSAEGKLIRYVGDPLELYQSKDGKIVETREARATFDSWDISPHLTKLLAGSVRDFAGAEKAISEFEGFTLTLKECLVESYLRELESAGIKLVNENTEVSANLIRLYSGIRHLDHFVEEQRARIASVRKQDAAVGQNVYGGGGGGVASQYLR
jgi:hypothetical protein